MKLTNENINDYIKISDTFYYVRGGNRITVRSPLMVLFIKDIDVPIITNFTTEKLYNISKSIDELVLKINYNTMFRFIYIGKSDEKYCYNDIRCTNLSANDLEDIINQNVKW